MPTYEQLYHLKLGNLKTAVDRWVETSTKFKGLHTSFGDRVERPYKEAGWRQPVMTAALAGTRANEAKQEFEDAGIEADGIAKVLGDLHTKLKAYQAELRECADVKAKNKGLHVSAKGEVTARDDLSDDPMRHHDPDYQDLIRQQHADIDAIVAELEGILQKATEADEEACYALNKNLGSNNGDFNDTVYTSLNEADATRDSARALELAGRGKDMTDQELAELNALLKEHSKDTTITADGKEIKDNRFAEKFATGLGPKGTLAFWSEMADPYGGAYGRSEEREKLLKDLQNQLGTTLGNATHSDSKAMTEWKQEMIKLGPQRLEIDDAGNPYGFQVMSNLMRHGEYDNAFLQSYGDTLIKTEKPWNDGDASHGLGLDRLWTGNFNSGDLNFGAKNDRGNDPMTGFLEALGHNPQASAKFLSDDEHFDYLVGGDEDTKARVWPHDTAFGGDRDKIGGYDSLGHALESATLGEAYGTDPSHPHRDMEGATKVMEKVVERYGADPGLVNERDGLQDSVARMGAAYMDDLNYQVADIGDAGDLIDKDKRFPADDHGRLDVTSREASNFLYGLAQDKESHAALSMAQQAYTSGQLADPNTTSTDARAVASVGATVHGILDQGRMDAIDEKYGDDLDAKNKEIAESTAWKTAATSMAVGAGVGLVAVPTMGVGAIAVPIAMGVAEGSANTYFGNSFNEAAEEEAKRYEDKKDDERRMDKQEYMDAGLTTSVVPVKSYVAQHATTESERVQMWSDVKGAYFDGAQYAKS
ncbi:hypothetical protein ACI2L1_01865 [Streptomyces sp. NPDC019531]|uniref:hypothetical protein n=1 Tax=Streptomyces sp. NPDC019531 TaxID=3365062 RepID=UPI00384F4F76